MSNDRNSLIFSAVKENDFKKIEKLVLNEEMLAGRQKYHGIRDDKSYEVTPIVYAAKLGHWNLVKEIADLVVKKNYQNLAPRYEFGWALFLAVVSGEYEAVEALIKAGADLKWNPRILEVAVERHHATVVDLLLQQKAFSEANRNELASLINPKDHDCYGRDNSPTRDFLLGRSEKKALETKPIVESNELPVPAPSIWQRIKNWCKEKMSSLKSWFANKNNKQEPVGVEAAIGNSQASMMRALPLIGERDDAPSPVLPVNNELAQSLLAKQQAVDDAHKTDVSYSIARVLDEVNAPWMQP